MSKPSTLTSATALSAELAAAVHREITGRDRKVATTLIYRWMKRGRSGVLLRSEYFDGRKCTTREWVSDFIHGTPNDRSESPTIVPDEVVELSGSRVRPPSQSVKVRSQAEARKRAKEMFG